LSQWAGCLTVIPSPEAGYNLEGGNFIGSDLNQLNGLFTRRLVPTGRSINKENTIEPNI
jgi:hypothetical protein